MGMNTTILILNDGLDQIEKHPDQFVDGIKQNLNSGGTVGVGNHANPVQVMSTAHADIFRLYATHQNTIIELSAFSKETEALYEMFPDVVQQFIRSARDHLDHLESRLGSAKDD